MCTLKALCVYVSWVRRGSGSPGAHVDVCACESVTEMGSEGFFFFFLFSSNSQWRWCAKLLFFFFFVFFVDTWNWLFLVEWTWSWIGALCHHADPSAPHSAASPTPSTHVVVVFVTTHGNAKLFMGKSYRRFYVDFIQPLRRCFVSAPQFQFLIRVTDDLNKVLSIETPISLFGTSIYWGLDVRNAGPVLWMSVPATCLLGIPSTWTAVSFFRWPGWSVLWTGQITSEFIVGNKEAGGVGGWAVILGIVSVYRFERPSVLRF